MKKITILLAMLLITTLGFSQTVIFTEDFESGGGAWTDQNLGDGDTGWAFDTGVVPGNVADFTTLAATFNDDAAANDGQHDYRMLWHGSEDVSSYSNIVLTYDYALNVITDNDDLLHVSLWDNANTVWINIKTYGTDTDPTTDSIDVSAALLANPGIDPNNLFFGFNYDDVDSDWAWGAGVDNVVLTGYAGDLDTMFIHTATAANISGNVTYLDHPYLNGNPNAKIVVSHNWENSGQLNEITQGVWYDNSLSKWAIYNEDITNMVVNTSYNVYIDGANSNTITHIASAANSGGNPVFTIIDDASVNGDPNAIIVFGRYWNPNSVYNPDNYGIFYNGTNWVIYNESNNPIPDGAAFNVVLAPSNYDVKAFKHQATVANTTQYWTELDNPLVNGNPDATIVFSHNWGAAGDASNVIVENTQSLWYDGASGTWRIFNDDISDMDTNVAFNVIVLETPAPVVSLNDTNLVVDFTIFPNPTNGTLNVRAKEDISKVAIYNLLGQEIKSMIPTSNDISMDVSNMDAGIYIVKLTANGAESSKRFIKK